MVKENYFKKEPESFTKKPPSSRQWNRLRWVALAVLAAISSCYAVQADLLSTLVAGLSGVSVAAGVVHKKGKGATVDRNGTPVRKRCKGFNTSVPLPTRLSSTNIDENSSYQKLLQAIQKDPDRDGLRDLWIDGKFFPGLSSKSFENKRMALLGDSTLFYPMKWLTQLMYSPNFNNNVTLCEGNQWLMQKALNNRNVALDKASPAVPYKQGNQTHFIWTGMKGPPATGEAMEDLVFKYKQNVKAMKPDIVVANLGLHWMHLFPTRSPTALNGVYRWLHYQGWMQNVVYLAQEAGTKILLFKTVNSICEDKFRDGYATWAKKYSTNDPLALELCHHKMQLLTASSWMLKHKFSEEEIDLFCRKGSMTEIGVQYLNEQIYDFVNRTQVPGMAIGVFNDHDVERCQYTAAYDGRHYHGLVSARLRLLAHLIKETEECMETYIDAPEFCVPHKL